MGWQLKAAADIGGRDEQQDRVEILSAGDGDAHLIVLADGMGGHLDGARAAQTVVETAGRLFAQTVPDPPSFLRELCGQAHRAIWDLREAEDRSPGSTCVLLYLDERGAFWAHVGDSRLYHFRAGELMDRTFDHSVLRLMLEQGRVRSTDPAAEQLQGQLYMRLGGSEDPVPDMGATPVSDGDLFLMCSDGLWAWVEPEEVASTLHDLPLEEGAAHLLELARARGGREGDNISLALARWPGAASRPLLKRLFSRRG
ncbi:MAG: protein phosphatase 2C domain-containing protein [Chromatiales bacterium]|jgi:serine/threonine protein phosphatase PrpC